MIISVKVHLSTFICPYSQEIFPLLSFYGLYLLIDVHCELSNTTICNIR